MDELSELISRLQKEVAELEGALHLREAEEAAKLKLEEGRLRVAEARLARAQALLKNEAAALAVVEEKRTHLLERIDGWRGQVWRIGYGSAVVVTLPLMATTFTLATTWFGMGWALSLFGAQAAFFGALFVLIPEKR